LSLPTARLSYDVLQEMLLFLTAFVCATAVLFAGVPNACNIANRIHIENGREPNAGIAFMPELIVMVVLWWGTGAGIRYFFGLPASLIGLLAVSALLVIFQIIQARKSNREYALFVAEHAVASANKNRLEQNKDAEQ